MDKIRDNLQFSWGKKKALGGKNKNCQFYESFIFDNVNYSLYDCVYLFKHGDLEPYIGKILKIWEDNNENVKRVKLLWFFFPNEVRNYLGDNTFSEKEIFLACGEGVGLSDLNPLEAIAGKCSVVCISKDHRNRQPSINEQDSADYMFSKVFDVGSCILSEVLPEKIAGIEVKFLLNQEGDQQAILNSKPEADEMDQDKLDAPVAPVLHSLTKSDSVKIVGSVVANDKPGHVLLDNSSEDKHLKGSDNFEERTAIESITDSAKEATKLIEENVNSTKNKSWPTLSSERPSKKLKISDGSEQAVGTQNGAGGSKPDKKKWFKFGTDEQLKHADEYGALAYIQNLDLSYAPSDVQEMIFAAVQQRCTVKFIHHPTYDDPNNGKAYLIFKTSEAADAAVLRINAGLVASGRPLYCSKGLLKVPKAPPILTGHLSTEKIRRFQTQREEMKKAVSTSHCSQPNTIEYDMALEWISTREKERRLFSELHKRHAEQRRQFARKK